MKYFLKIIKPFVFYGFLYHFHQYLKDFEFNCNKICIW